MRGLLSSILALVIIASLQWAAPRADTQAVDCQGNPMCLHAQEVETSRDNPVYVLYRHLRDSNVTISLASFYNSKADIPLRDSGYWVAWFDSEREGVRAYFTAVWGTDGTGAWTFLRQDEGGWYVAAVATRDFHDPLYCVPPWEAVGVSPVLDAVCT